MLNKLLFLSKSSFSAFQILEQSFLFFFYNKQILHIFKSHFHVILLFVSALLLSPKLIFLFTFWLIYLLLSTWVRTLVNLYASFANFPSHFFPFSLIFIHRFANIVISLFLLNLKGKEEKHNTI